MLEWRWVRLSRGALVAAREDSDPSSAGLLFLYAKQRSAEGNCGAVW